MTHRGLIQRVFLFATATVIAVGCSGGAGNESFSEEAFEDESALQAEDTLEADEAVEAEDVGADEAEEIGTSQQGLTLPELFPPNPPRRPFVPCAGVCPFGTRPTGDCTCEPENSPPRVPEPCFLFCPFGTLDTESCSCGPSPFEPTPFDPCVTMLCVSGQCVDGRCE